MIPDLNKLSYRRLLIFSACLSIIFSILELLPANPIDSDALTYIKTAQAYWQGGWQAALKIYPWPFFSIFGAWLSQLTHFSLENSFHIMNTLLQAMLVVVFIAMVKQLGGDARCQRFAALVILIYPFLNAIRVYATRDSGYWAFGLLAIYFLLKFMAEARLRYALLWAISMGIASLFRIEGFIMLLMAPLALLLQPQQSVSTKIQRFIFANFIFIIVIICAIGWHFTHPHLGDASRLKEFQIQLQKIPIWIQHLYTDADKIRAVILDANSQENAMPILLGGLLIVFLLCFIKVMEPLYLILACYGQTQKLISNRYGYVTLLNFLILINLLMLAVFTLERYFVSTRYPAFMVLLWLTWVPFSLQRLRQNWREYKNPRWLWPIIVLILIYMAIGGLIRFGYSKTYIPESGDWLYQHMLEDDTLATNANQVVFYASNHFNDAKRKKDISEMTLDDAVKKSCQYDWLALRINRGDDVSHAVQRFLNQHQAKIVFTNKRNDSILIYQTQDFCS